MTEQPRRSRNVGQTHFRVLQPCGATRCWGNSFLYTEGLPLVLAEQGLAGLVRVVAVELSDEQVDTVYEHGTNWSGLWLSDDPSSEELT